MLGFLLVLSLVSFDEHLISPIDFLGGHLLLARNQTPDPTFGRIFRRHRTHHFQLGFPVLARLPPNVISIIIRTDSYLDNTDIFRYKVS